MGQFRFSVEKKLIFALGQGKTGGTFSLNVAVQGGRGKT